MKKLLILFIVLFILATGGYVLYKQSVDEEEIAAVDEQPLGGPVEVDAADVVNMKTIRYPSLEERNYTVVVYVDPQDAGSREYVSTVRNATAEYNETVAYAVKHFPIHIHPTARDEAGAIECAGQQGKFYEYMDAIFAESTPEEAIAEDLLNNTAESLGLDMNAFNICRDEELFHEDVRDDALEAMSLGATGVPYSVITDQNGIVIQRIKGVVSESALSLAIQNAALINDVAETAIEEQQ